MSKTVVTLCDTCVSKDICKYCEEMREYQKQYNSFVESVGPIKNRPFSFVEHAILCRHR